MFGVGDIADRPGFVGRPQQWPRDVTVARLGTTWPGMQADRRARVGADSRNLHSHIDVWRRRRPGHRLIITPSRRGISLKSRTSAHAAMSWFRCNELRCDAASWV